MITNNNRRQTMAVGQQPSRGAMSSEPIPTIGPGASHWWENSNVWIWPTSLFDILYGMGLNYSSRRNIIACFVARMLGFIFPVRKLNNKINNDIVQLPALNDPILPKWIQLWGASNNFWVTMESSSTMAALAMLINLGYLQKRESSKWSWLKRMEYRNHHHCWCANHIR